jgi:outer membrane protein assembly factor BamB
MPRQTSTFLWMACLVCLFTNEVSVANDWPMFRGPKGNGVVESTQHPLKWTNDQNIAWSVTIEGGGWSSPVVAGDRVFITTAVGHGKPVGFMDGVRNMRSTKPTEPVEFRLICLSLKDGSQLWEKTLATKTPEHPIHPSNTYATETPATDGQHIFSYFAAIGLVAAHDVDGNEIWQREIGSFASGNGFGTGSSVAIDDQRVFIQCDNDESSFMVALDKSNGTEVWKKARDGRTSWSTPLVWKNSNRTEVIACGSGYVTSYEPATGQELWKVSGIGMSFSGSPAADDERVYFGNSGPRSNGPLVAIGNQANGEFTFDSQNQSEQVAWFQMQAGPGMSSPIAIADVVYVPSRRIMTAYDTVEGKRLFKERLDLQSTAASMWGASDYVFLLDETGQTLVIKTGPQFEVVGKNKIDDLFWSTPAVAGKSLLLRGANKLYCIRE